MHIVHTLADLRRALKPTAHRALVPTMGSLHPGHLELMQTARHAIDKRAVEDKRSGSGMTVASIFVNRLQFGPNEDFDTYPRTLENDCALLKANGCDLVFAPSEKELYPEPQLFKVHPPAQLADILEGAFRPGFFVGVCTVVHKLFNIVQPNLAVFGKKDYQQLMVIRRMVQQMALPIEIIGSETRRTEDGLALSSRNGYLSTEERAEAVQLSMALKGLAAAAREGHATGVLDVASAEAAAMDALRARGWQPDYITLRHQHDLSPVAGPSAEPLVVLGAAKLGKTRLIDNWEV
ncbi:pantoate--beta-alanine ligase [Limnohabitans sp.]|jgi:pantoate--beta-alanine ligase|uniref:pantoate--beta-alanine ligase n=1 Tax=Limnohabitans sp. TaxID=1907725 RepID=UPI002FDE5F08